MYDMYMQLYVAMCINEISEVCKVCISLAMCIHSYAVAIHVQLLGYNYKVRTFIVQ